MADLLKVEWNSGNHPRWPAGSPNSIGGQFAPVGEGSASAIPAQFAIPLDIPAPIPFPLPSEVTPPLVTPSFPRNPPLNPYPDRPECVKEWEDAREYCQNLRDRGLSGRGDYKWMGRTIAQWVMGQVSEACGGNPTA